MLKIGDKVFWGLIAPGIIFSTLFVLPYVEVGPSRRYADRRIGLSAAMVVIVGVSMLTFMGTPWYAVSSSADQEVIAELVPQTKPGPLRSANWDDLAVGDYQASAWQSAPTATLQGLLHEFQTGIDQHISADSTGKFKNAKGELVIENAQDGLKLISIKITWTDATGDRSTVQPLYLHRDSNYGE
jgi:hypothetical protein